MSAYVDLTTRFTYLLPTVFGDFNSLANNDKFLKENGWQDGTIAVFFQASAPVGWTKQTTQDGKVVRVVSGSGGGSGGSLDPAAPITMAHTHTIPTDSDHTHALVDHTHHVVTSGTDKANGASNVEIGSGPGTGSHDLVLRNGTSGASTVQKKLNSLALSTSYATGAAGSHNHGGATASALTDISLAYINVLYCSKDTSSGYTDLSSTFVHNVRHVTDYLIECGLNDAFNYARLMPAGSISFFWSVTAPVGWTKTTTNDDQLLRVVNTAGGGSSLGTRDPAAVITLDHTHADLSSDGSHSHSVPAHVHNMANSGAAVASNSPSNIVASSAGQLREYSRGASTTVNSIEDRTAADGGGTSSTDGAHIHEIGSQVGASNITLAYVTVISASKDSAGAPQVYTDMTTFFVPVSDAEANAPLLAYQDLQKMAYNDAYINYHTPPSGATMFFFQSAAPLNWTKVTTHNDKFLKIVNDATGGNSGGSTGIAVGLQLAHYHGITGKSHAHTFSHSHTLAAGAGYPTTSIIASTRIYGASGAELYRQGSGGAGDTSLGTTTDSVTADTDTYTHNHGNNTPDGLTNITLAYADVIMCSKN